MYVEYRPLLSITTYILVPVFDVSLLAFLSKLRLLLLKILISLLRTDLDTNLDFRGYTIVAEDTF